MQSMDAVLLWCSMWMHLLLSTVLTFLCSELQDSGSEAWSFVPSIRVWLYYLYLCCVLCNLQCLFCLCPDLPTNIFGMKLKEQVEDRLKFYETGDIPRKNVDVMTDALAEVSCSSGHYLLALTLPGWLHFGWS